MIDRFSEIFFGKLEKEKEYENCDYRDWRKYRTVWHSSGNGQNIQSR